MANIIAAITRATVNIKSMRLIAATFLYSRAGLVNPAALRNKVSMKRLQALAQLPRIPKRRSSENTYSTHSGE